MRIYEELFIVQPEAPEEEVDQIVEQLTSSITQGGGQVDKVEKWGKRRLAYRIDKFREGFYVLIQFTAPATAVKELERRLRVTDAVIKYLTVRVDETLKRIEKRRKQREKRAARRPPAPTPPPAMPAAPLPASSAPATPVPGLPEEKEA